jgi:transcriptional regulator with XRE-family HTH domain
MASAPEDTLMSFDRDGFDKEVGLLLQVARKRRGMTQEELAFEIGVQRASYANVEAGRQRVPLDIVWRAAVVLGVSISSLVPEAISAPRHPATHSAQEGEAFSTSYNLSDLLIKLPASK